jgi:hypothetical protein
MGKVRSILKHQNPLPQSLTHNLDLPGGEIDYCLLEVADATVHELRRCARGCRSKITGIDQHGAQAAQLRVQSAAGSGCAPTDYANIERLRFNRTQCLSASFHVSLDYVDAQDAVEFAQRFVGE